MEKSLSFKNNSSRFAPFAPFILFPLLIGLFLPVAPIITALAALAVAVLVIMEISAPLATVTMVFLISCTFLPPETIPRVPIGFGAELFITDFIFIYLMLSCVFSGSRIKNAAFPIALPMIVLVFVALVNSAVTFGVLGVQFSHVGSELRGYMYLLMAFPVFFRTAGKNNYRKFEEALKWTALIAAVVVTTQWVTGDRISWLMSNIKQLHTMGEMNASTFRVKPPGLVLMHMAFIMALGRFMGEKKNRARNLLFMIVIGCGLAASFHRYIFITIMMAALFFTGIMPGGGVSKKIILLGTILLAGLFAGYILSMTVPAFSDWSEALAERFQSMGEPEELKETDTISNRFIEYIDAAPVIAASPAFGVGIGNIYRSSINSSGSPGEFDGDRYLHNAYVMVQLKMGFIGLILYLWVCVGYLLWWLRKGRKKELCPDPVLHFTLGICFIMLMIVNLVSASMTTVGGATVAGAIMGLNAAASIGVSGGCHSGGTKNSNC